MTQNASNQFSAETKAGNEVWDHFGDEERRAELSHWRGFGKWVDHDRWTAVGRKSKKLLDRAIRDQKMRGFWDTPRAMLEWGPGGGANAFVLKDNAKSYFGVDISEKNLTETGRVCAEAGFDGFRPVLVRDDPQDILSQVDQPIEVFLSTAVFQHFPSKAYGIHVLEMIHKVTVPDAVGLIQIRYNDGTKKFAGNESVEQYKKNFIIATTYAIEEFWTAAEKIGFSVIFTTDLNPSVNYISLLMRRR